MTESTRMEEVLAQFLSDFGMDNGDDASRVRGGLNDLLGPEARRHRAEVDALVAAVDAGVVAALRGPDGGSVDHEALVVRLADREIDPDLARAAVSAWDRVLRPDEEPVIVGGTGAPLVFSEVVPTLEPYGPDITAVPVDATILPGDTTHRSRRTALLVVAAAVAVLAAAGTAFAFTRDDPGEVATTDTPSEVDGKDRSPAETTTPAETAPPETPPSEAPPDTAPPDTPPPPLPSQPPQPTLPQPPQPAQPRPTVTVTVPPTTPKPPSPSANIYSNEAYWHQGYWDLAVGYRAHFRFTGENVASWQWQMSFGSYSEASVYVDCYAGGTVGHRLVVWNASGESRSYDFYVHCY